jgi:hypothetical protein
LIDKYSSTDWMSFKHSKTEKLLQVVDDLLNWPKRLTSEWRAIQSKITNDNPSHRAKRERIYEGLRMAGVPEGAAGRVP